MEKYITNEILINEINNMFNTEKFCINQIKEQIGYINIYDKGLQDCSEDNRINTKLIYKQLDIRYNIINKIEKTLKYFKSIYSNIEDSIENNLEEETIKMGFEYGDN